jgi:O-glycosyl hydrolase
MNCAQKKKVKSCFKIWAGMTVALSALTMFTSGQAQTCYVNWTNVFQRIDGFGASSAWESSMSTTLADLFFSTNNGIVYTDSTGYTTTNNGIGLSLLRNRIAPALSTSPIATPTTSETSIMQAAQQRGALVWSTPWTPPSGFKTTNSPNGGNYKGSGANSPTNLAYASQLANYVHSMNSQGINIYAISVQNEPDFSTTNYESCLWTGSQIHDFVTNLYNALVAKGEGSTKIIIPESEHWSGDPSLYTLTLNDPNTEPVVSIIANHNYDDCPPDYPPTALSTPGQSVWETEVSKLKCAGGFDGSIDDGIYWAGRIHLFMTVAQANAWHYWWLISGNPDNEGLTDNTSPNPVLAKRMFVLGQWSRFVRPGYYRIAAGDSSEPPYCSAYKDPNSNLFAIVAINSSFTDVTEVFNLVNFPAVSSVTPWITSGSLSLAQQPAFNVTNTSPNPISTTNYPSFAYELPARSVVTFVGQATNAPPTLMPVANQTINAGFPLQVTNLATDPDLPSQNLTFSLLSAPTNATLTPLNATNAVFAWRPLVSQASSTNPVSVAVADSGWPILSATNNFTVTVNPLTNPVIGSVTVTGGQVSLGVTDWGLQGPDYTLETATNLLGTWQVLFTVGSTNSPVTLMTDTNSTDPVRFYRIQIGP